MLIIQYLFAVILYFDARRLRKKGSNVDPGIQSTIFLVISYILEIPTISFSASSSSGELKKEYALNFPDFFQGKFWGVMIILIPLIIYLLLRFKNKKVLLPSAQNPKSPRLGFWIFLSTLALPLVLIALIFWYFG
ncbi:MAG: hypothetical protein G01um101420_830 [Parcubacteria group bacterium Gr01-1014_20]|nr:MAG: hypothetical protein G01um101420_830 [Parcubacteria group bacterium Gr01-1014_20]